MGAGASLKPSAQIPGLPLCSNRPPAQWAGGLVISSYRQRKRKTRRQGGPVRGPVPGPGPPCPLGLRASPPAHPCAAGSASRGRSSRLLHRAGAPEDGRSVGTPSRPRRTIPRRASPRSFWVSVSPSVRCALRRMPARRSPKGKREPVAATPSVGCSRHRAPCGQGRQQQSSSRRPAGEDSARNDKRQRQRPGTPPSTPGTTDSAAPWATLRPLAQARRAAEQEQAHAPIGPAMGPIVPFRAVAPPGTV